MKKQHTTPCAKCPFRKASLPGWLGGGTPEDFLSMANSEARMPCHCAAEGWVDYAAAQQPGTPEHALPQCAGRAIFWANQCHMQRPGSNLLELPPDGAKAVFHWSTEFLDHHNRYKKDK